MAKLKFLEMTFSSYEEAFKYAKEESNRTGKTCWLIEYREKDSPDDMRFFEVVEIDRLVVLRQYYEELNTLRFNPFE